MISISQKVYDGKVFFSFTSDNAEEFDDYLCKILDYLGKEYDKRIRENEKIAKENDYSIRRKKPIKQMYDTSYFSIAPLTFDRSKKSALFVFSEKQYNEINLPEYKKEK